MVGGLCHLSPVTPWPCLLLPFMHPKVCGQLGVQKRVVGQMCRESTRGSGQEELGSGLHSADLGPSDQVLLVSQWEAKVRWERTAVGGLGDGRPAVAVRSCVITGRLLHLSGPPPHLAL